MGRVQRNRRNNKRRNIRRSRRTTFCVKETFVTNVAVGSIATVPASLLSNVPRFSIWRPKLVQVQASVSGSNTYPALQIIMFNSSAEKVNSSSVQLLNVDRTNVWCRYPSTAEWFSPIGDDSKATVFDIRVLCTGTTPGVLVGLVINMTVEVKNEIPAVVCPKALPTRPIDDDDVIPSGSRASSDFCRLSAPLATLSVDALPESP